MQLRPTQARPAPRRARTTSVLAPPVRVRVVPLDAERRDLAAETVMGTLVDRIEVGKGFRVATGGDALLASSVVVGVESIDAENVRVSTANHVYRVERLASAVGGQTLAVDLTTARLAAFRLRSARFRQGGAGGGTGFVAVQADSKPGAGKWRSGARVMITRLRGAGEDTGPLGRGVLMDDLEVGSAARFAVDQGASLVTSAVRSLQRLGPSSVQVATGNSTYRFDLLGKD